LEKSRPYVFPENVHAATTSFNSISLAWEPSTLYSSNESDTLRVRRGFRLVYANTAADNSDVSAVPTVIVLDSGVSPEFSSFTMEGLLPASQYTIIVQYLYDEDPQIGPGSPERIGAQVPQGYVASSQSIPIVVSTAGDVQMTPPTSVALDQAPRPVTIVLQWEPPAEPQWHSLVNDQNLPLDSQERHYTRIVYALETAVSQDGPWQSVASVPITVDELVVEDTSRVFTPATAYYYRVGCQATISNASDSIAVCKTSDVAMLYTPGQRAPRNLHVRAHIDNEADEADFVLRWQEPLGSGNEPATFDAYEFEYVVGGERSQTIHINNPSATQYIFSLASPMRGVAYAFTLYAVDQDGRGSPAVASSNALASPTNPPRQLFARNRLGTQLELVWSPPHRNGVEFQFPITHYQVQFRSYNAVDQVNSEWTGIDPAIDVSSADLQASIKVSRRISTTVSDLTPEALYEFRVLAGNARGLSNPSASILARTFESQYDAPRGVEPSQEPGKSSSVELQWVAFERHIGTLFETVPVTEYHINWRAHYSIDPALPLNEWQAAPLIVPVTVAQEGSVMTALIHNIEADMQYSFSISAASEAYGAGEEAVISYRTAPLTVNTCRNSDYLPNALSSQTPETVSMTVPLHFEHSYIPVPESSVVTGANLHLTQAHWFRIYGPNRMINFDICSAATQLRTQAGPTTSLVAAVILFDSLSTSCPFGRDRETTMANSMPPQSVFDASPVVFRSRIECSSSMPPKWSFFAAYGFSYRVVIGIESSVDAAADRTLKQLAISVSSSPPRDFVFFRSAVDFALDFAVFDPDNVDDNNIVMQHDATVELTRSVGYHRRPVSVPVHSYLSVSTRARFDQSSTLVNDTALRYSLDAPANDISDYRLENAEYFRDDRQYNMSVQVGMQLIRGQDVHIQARTTVGPLRINGFTAVEKLRNGRIVSAGRTEVWRTSYDYTDVVTGVDTNYGTGFVINNPCNLDSVAHFRLATAMPLESFRCTVSFNGQLVSQGVALDGGCEMTMRVGDIIDLGKGTYDMVFTYQLMDDRLETVVRSFTQPIHVIGTPHAVFDTLLNIIGLLARLDPTKDPPECPADKPLLPDLTTSSTLPELANHVASTAKHRQREEAKSAHGGFSLMVEDDAVRHSLGSSQALSLVLRTPEGLSTSIGPVKVSVKMELGVTLVHTRGGSGHAIIAYLNWKTIYGAELDFAKTMGTTANFKLIGDRQGQMVTTFGDIFPFEPTAEFELKAVLAASLSFTIPIYPRVDRAQWKQAEDSLEGRVPRVESEIDKALDLLETLNAPFSLSVTIEAKVSAFWLESAPVFPQQEDYDLSNAAKSDASFLAFFVIAPIPKAGDSITWGITLTISLNGKLNSGDSGITLEISGALSVFWKRTVKSGKFEFQGGRLSLSAAACMPMMCVLRVGADFDIFSESESLSGIDPSDPEAETLLRNAARRIAHDAFHSQQSAKLETAGMTVTRGLPHRSKARVFLGSMQHQGGTTVQQTATDPADSALPPVRGSIDGTIVSDVMQLAFPSLITTQVSEHNVAFAAWVTENTAAARCDSNEFCPNDLAIEVAMYESHCWSPPALVVDSPYADTQPKLAVATPQLPSEGVQVMLLFSRYWNDSVHDPLLFHPGTEAQMQGLMFSVWNGDRRSSSWSQPVPLPLSGAQAQLRAAVCGLTGVIFSKGADGGPMPQYPKFMTVFITDTQDGNSNTTHDSDVLVSFYRSSDSMWSLPTPVLDSPVTDAIAAWIPQAKLFVHALTGDVVMATVILTSDNSTQSSSGNPSSQARFLVRICNPKLNVQSAKSCANTAQVWTDVTPRIGQLSRAWTADLMNVQIAVQDSRRLVLVWHNRGENAMYGFVDPALLLDFPSAPTAAGAAVRGPFSLPFGIGSEMQDVPDLRLVGNGDTGVVLHKRQRRADTSAGPSVNNIGIMSLTGDTFGAVREMPEPSQDTVAQHRRTETTQYAVAVMPTATSASISHPTVISVSVNKYTLIDEASEPTSGANASARAVLQQQEAQKWYNIDFSEVELKPDLVITQVHVYAANETNCTISDPHCSFAVDVTVRNQGFVPSGATALLLHTGSQVGPVLLGSFSEEAEANSASAVSGGIIAALAAGQSVSVPLVWEQRNSPDSTAFQGFIWLTVDPDDTEQELSERNNRIGVQVSAPQLDVTSIRSLPDPVQVKMIHDEPGFDVQGLRESATRCDSIDRNTTSQFGAEIHFRVRDNLPFTSLVSYVQVSLTNDHSISGRTASSNSNSIEASSSSVTDVFTSTKLVPISQGQEYVDTVLVMPFLELQAETVGVHVHHGDTVIVQQQLSQEEAAAQFMPYVPFSSADVRVTFGVPEIQEARERFRAQDRDPAVRITGEANLYFFNSLDVRLLNANQGLVQYLVTVHHDSILCLDDVSISIYGIPYDSANASANGTRASTGQLLNHTQITETGYSYWGSESFSIAALSRRRVIVDAGAVEQLVPDDVESALYHVLVVIDVNGTIVETIETDNSISVLSEIAKSNTAELGVVRASYFAPYDSVQLRVSIEYRSRSAIGVVSASAKLYESINSTVEQPLRDLGMHAIDFGNATNEACADVALTLDISREELLSIASAHPGYVIVLDFENEAKLGPGAIMLLLSGAGVSSTRERDCNARLDIVTTGIPVSPELFGVRAMWSIQNTADVPIVATWTDASGDSGNVSVPADDVATFATPATEVLYVSYRVRLTKDIDEVVGTSDVDCLPPVVRVKQNFTLVLGADGTTALNAADVDAGSMSECGSLSKIEVDPTHFSAADLGETSIRLTVHDNFSQSTSALTAIQVVDETPPVFSTCPYDIVREVPRAPNGPALADSVIVDWPEPVVYDTASGVASVIADVGARRKFGVGETLVTYTATDNSNNQNTNCSFYIIVLNREEQCSTSYERAPNPVMTFEFDAVTAESVVRITFEQDRRFDEHGFASVALTFGAPGGRLDDDVHNDTCVFSTESIMPSGPYSGIEKPESTMQHVWKRVEDTRAIDCKQTWELRLPSVELRTQCFPAGVTTAGKREEVFTQTLYAVTKQNLRAHGMSRAFMVRTMLPLTVSIRVQKTAVATPGGADVIGEAYALKLLGDFRVTVDDSGAHSVAGTFITETPWPYVLSSIHTTHGDGNMSSASTSQFGMVDVESDVTTAQCNMADSSSNDRATGPSCIQEWHFSYAILDACAQPGGTRRLNREQLNFAFEVGCVDKFDGECAPQFDNDIGLQTWVSSGEFCVVKEVGLVASAITYAWSGPTSAPAPSTNESDAYFLTSGENNPTDISIGDYHYREQSVYTTEAVLFGEVHIAVEDNQYPVERTTIYRIVTFEGEGVIANPDSLESYTVVYKDCSLEELVSCDDVDANATTYFAHDSAAVANSGFGDRDGVYASSHSRFMLQLNDRTMRPSSNQSITQLRVLVDMYVETTPLPQDRAGRPYGTILSELSRTQRGQSRVVSYAVNPKPQLSSDFASNSVVAEIDVTFVNQRDGGPQNPEDSGDDQLEGAPGGVSSTTVGIAVAAGAVVGVIVIAVAYKVSAMQQAASFETAVAQDGSGIAQVHTVAGPGVLELDDIQAKFNDGEMALPTI
jgi:HYR domain/Fibronectin type III domain